MPSFLRCSVCKQEKACPWQCEICARAGLLIELCSPLCRARHQRDGRHRKEARAARRPPK